MLMTVFPRLVTLTLFGSLVTSSVVLAQDNIVLKNGTEIPAKVLEVSPEQIKYRRQDNPDGPIYSTGTADLFLIKYANGTKDILNGSRPSNGSSSPASGIVTGTVNTGSPMPTLTKLMYHHGLFSRYFSNELNERLDRRQVQTALATHPEAFQTYQRGQSLRRWSYVTGGTAIALLGTGAVVALMGERGGENNHRTGLNDTDRTGNGFERWGEHGSTEVGLALAGGGVLLGVAALYLDHRATVQFRRTANRYNGSSSTSLHFGPSSRGVGIGVTLMF